MFARCRRFLAPPTIEDVSAAFKVLGLSFNPRLPAASQPGIDDVRRQYRELARLHHPDLSNGDDNRMKVVNTAYELIQSSGVLQGAYAAAATGATSPDAAGQSGAPGGRFTRKAGSRRRRMPDDFANGDDSSWTMKSSLDWQTMMNSTDTLTDAELKNPANHPFSHSKFFSIEEDATIYRMIRGGATVQQVGRTLGKPATFVERRLQNAQFKMRIQYLLRSAKRGQQASKQSATKGSTLGDEAGAEVRRGCPPITESVTKRFLRRSPFEGGDDVPTAAAAAASRGLRDPSSRKKEWEPTYPMWAQPLYEDTMTLEQRGIRRGVLKEPSMRDGEHPERKWVNHKKPTASKIGRSYANYSRLSGKRRGSAN